MALTVVALVLVGCSETIPGLPGGRPTAADAPPSGPIGPADGVIDGRVSVDADVPAVTKLDPALLRAMRRAAAGAAEDGIEVAITSGWRSSRYQQSLYDDAVREYGSAAKARRLVAPAASSEHVTGDAVDVGPTDAAYWMSRFGERYGLCRIYRNEVWHYELQRGSGCPELVPDAAARQR